jgi:hypothetical protein
MIIHDPIFEQNYRKLFDKANQAAFDAGRVQGINEVLAIMHHLSGGDKKLVSFSAVMAAVNAQMSVMDQKKQQAKQQAKQKQENPVNSNPCGEIKLGQTQECSLSIPEVKKKPKLEIVK